MMTQSSENLVMDGQTDRWTDIQTDESDFTGHCMTNVERPKEVTKELRGVSFQSYIKNLKKVLFLNSELERVF